MRSPRWVLIQHDQDPYRTQRRTEGQPREDPGRAQPSTHEQRGLRRTPPCPHLDLGLQPPGPGDGTLPVGGASSVVSVTGPGRLTVAQDMLAISNRKERAGQSFGKPVFCSIRKEQNPRRKAPKLKANLDKGQHPREGGAQDGSRCDGGGGKQDTLPANDGNPRNSSELVGRSSAQVT